MVRPRINLSDGNPLDEPFNKLLFEAIFRWAASLDGPFIVTFLQNYPLELLCPCRILKLSLPSFVNFDLQFSNLLLPRGQSHFYPSNSIICVGTYLNIEVLVTGLFRLNLSREIPTEWAIAQARGNYSPNQYFETVYICVAFIF